LHNSELGTEIEIASFITLSERVRRVSRRVSISHAVLCSCEVRALFPVEILRLRDPSGRSAQDDYWGFLQEARRNMKKYASMGRFYSRETGTSDTGIRGA